MLLENDPSAYFTTPHFDGYAAVLVRLAKIAKTQLRELLTDAWLVRAPRRVADAIPDSSIRCAKAIVEPFRTARPASCVERRPAIGIVALFRTIRAPCHCAGTTVRRRCGHRSIRRASSTALHRTSPATDGESYACAARRLRSKCRARRTAMFATLTSTALRTIRTHTSEKATRKAPIASSNSDPDPSLCLRNAFGSLGRKSAAARPRPTCRRYPRNRRTAMAIAARVAVSRFAAALHRL